MTMSNTIYKTCLYHYIYLKKRKKKKEEAFIIIIIIMVKAENIKIPSAQSSLQLDRHIFYNPLENLFVATITQDKLIKSCCESNICSP